MSAQPELPATASRPLRLGFLGLGWIGRKRLDAAAELPEIEVAALADVETQRVREVAERFPGAIAARDVAELLKCDVDGVVIATPNSCHAQQALECLERGIPVFCQKPLAISAAESKRVVAAAQSSDRLLGIDYCYRHVSGMHELRRCIAAGELGDILAVELTFHNAYGPDKPWCYERRLSGGGCLLDLGVHLIDLALWLQAAPAMELVSSNLFAQGQPVRGGEEAIEDLAFATFRQSSGAVIRLACSWNAHVGRGAVIEMRLLATKGGAHWRNIDGSFYDFQLDLTRGTSCERIGSAPDDWGARALSSWCRRLQHDRSFDPEALLILPGASLIDEVYRS
jgi:predicted dehydrogenase